VVNGISGERRRKEEEFIKCDSCSMWATSKLGEAEGSYCCRKCEEIAHVRVVITRLKERIDNLQQVAECEKFVDNSWLRLSSEAAEDIGSVDDAAGAGGGGCAAGAGNGRGAVCAGSGGDVAGAGSGGGAVSVGSGECAAI